MMPGQHLEQAIAALRFAPMLPVWLLGALAAACVALLALAGWRRARGVLWRAAAFAVLLLWLSGPRLVEETRQTQPDIALIVVDQTASMQVGGRAALAAAARDKLAQDGAALPDLELRTITVPESGKEGTRLFAAIDHALADIPRARLAGIIAITDGQVHDAPATPGWGAPLHLLLPARAEETDRRLRILEAPGYGLVGKTVTLRLIVEDLGLPRNGLARGAIAQLTLRRDGEAPVVEQVPVGVEHDITLPVTRGGPSVIALSVDPLPGEASTLNNTAIVTLNGVRDRLKVLLVSGEPHPGERAWRRLLKADPAVDLVHFTILRPPDKDDLTPLNELALIPFPMTELFQNKIKDFDLIILDRFNNRGLLPPQYLRNIANYVRQGGALLVSAGPEFTGAAALANTPLGAILPARPLPGGASTVEGGFRPAISPLGQRHPVTQDLDATDWGAWYRRVPAQVDSGSVVMTAPDGSPLLVLSRVDQGRVALLLSDQIWLWSRGHGGGGPQAELLRRLAHWLMQEPELEETALTARIEAGHLLIERRSTAPQPAPAVTVTAPDGHDQSVALRETRPGRASATLAAEQPGVWRVSDGTASAYAATMAANPPEIADLRATATVLAPLVRASGGSVQWLGASGVPALRRTEPGQTAGGTGWIGLQRRHDHVVTGLAAFTLLPPGLALPLVLGLLLLAWRREGG